MGRNHTDRLAVSATRPPTRPARPPAALQTTTIDDDDSEQNNTGPLGGPVRNNSNTSLIYPNIQAFGYCFNNGIFCHTRGF